MQDTIQIGDTLWLASTFDNHFEIIDEAVTEVYSGKIRLALSLDVIRANANPENGSDIFFAKEDFDIIEAIGEHDDRSRMIWVWPTVANNRYEVKLGLIAKKSGLYILYDGTGSFAEEPYVKLLGTFNVTDIHSDLIDPSFYWASKLVSEFDYKGVTNRTYCFYVK